MTDQFSTKLTGGALVVAPLLLLAATILFITGGEGMNNSEPAGAVLVWAMVAFAVGLLGMARNLEASAPRGAALLRVLVVVGCIGGAGWAVDAMHAALTGGTNLADSGGALVPLGLMIPGALFPAAVAATGIALGRADLISRQAMLLIVVGAVLFPASRMPSIPALSVAADVVLIIGLVPVGLAQLAKSRRGVERRTAPAAT